MSISEKV